jgi:hypothetical protein
VTYLPSLESIAIGFADKTGILLPIDHYPEFSTLTYRELGRIEIGYAGGALSWRSGTCMSSGAGRPALR